MAGLMRGAGLGTRWRCDNALMGKTPRQRKVNAGVEVTIPMPRWLRLSVRPKGRTKGSTLGREVLGETIGCCQRPSCHDTSIDEEASEVKDHKANQQPSLT